MYVGLDADSAGRADWSRRRNPPFQPAQPLGECDILSDMPSYRRAFRFARVFLFHIQPAAATLNRVSRCKVNAGRRGAVVSVHAARATAADYAFGSNPPYG